MCDHFNQADLLRKYIEELPSRTPVHEAMRLLFKAVKDRSLAEEALHICRAVDVMGSQDPDTLVFLYWWIQAASNPQETIACTRLARSFAVDSSSANPLAFILGNEAISYAALNDYSHFLASAQEALQVARGAKPRIQMRTVANLAYNFSLLGCRSRIQEDLDLAQQNHPPPDVRDRFRIADLIEATEAFRIDEANRILERLSHGYQAPPYDVYLAFIMQEMLHVYLSMFPGQKPDPVHTPFVSGSNDPGDQGEEEVAMARTIYGHLHNRRPEQALKAVYEMYKAIGESLLTRPGTYGYLLTRCELSNGNINAARRALNVRKDAGLKAPLDAFFHARIALLQQDPGSANVLFRQCLSGMDALNARNRLIFELALSAEIPIPVLMEWTRILNEPPVARDALVRRTEQQVDFPPFESGIRPKSNVSQRIIRHASPGVTRLVGESHETETLRQFIKRMAHQDVPVLIMPRTNFHEPY